MPGGVAVFAERLLTMVNSPTAHANEDAIYSTQEKRMALEWMDKYKVGDVKIDAEHQEWFRLANRFLMADEQQALQQTGEAFADYTRLHFVQEETLMQEVQFPFIESHVKDHGNLVSTLEKILEVADKDVLTQSELEEFVGYWLVKHITTFDAPFSIYIRRNGVPALM